MTCDRPWRRRYREKRKLISNHSLLFSPLSTRGYLWYYILNLFLFCCSCQTRVKSTFQEVSILWHGWAYKMMMMIRRRWIWGSAAEECDQSRRQQVAELITLHLCVLSEGNSRLLDGSPIRANNRARQQQPLTFISQCETRNNKKTTQGQLYHHHHRFAPLAAFDFLCRRNKSVYSK